MIRCLFGHKYTLEVFIGKYGRVFSPLLGRYHRVPIVRTERRDYCIRCGKREPKPEPATCGCQHCN